VVDNMFLIIVTCMQ